MLCLSTLLIVNLSGCITKTVYVEKQVPLFPPDSLIQDCLIEDIKGNKVIDAIEQGVWNITHLTNCNKDKSSLREWKTKLQQK